MRLRNILISSALVMTSTLLGCAAAKPNVNGTLGGIVVLPIKPSVYVRATFDSDASSLIGAFIPDDVADSDIDESVAAHTRCSEFIKVKPVPASGNVEEVFGASSSVGGKIGIKGMAYLKGERSNTNALRINYTALQKLTAAVDAQGLRECCQVQPDQCAGRYISSALQGDGRIFAATEQADQAGLEAEGTAKGVPISGDFLYKDGLKWERKTDFKAQYFAFTLQRANVGKAAVELADDCAWTKKIPRSLEGSYFVGVSEPLPSEQSARREAINDARLQVVKYLGEYLEQASKSSSTLSGGLGAVGGHLEDKTDMAKLSGSLAQFVKDERWCIEEEPTPEGKKKTGKVLSFFPNEGRASAARLSITNVMEGLKAKGQLSAEREQSLRAALAAIK